MLKTLRNFLVFTLIFAFFVFAVCEMQVTDGTGIIDKNKLISFRLKNGSTGVLTAFGNKAYIDMNAIDTVEDVAGSVVGFGTAFLPQAITGPIADSAKRYGRVFNDMTSLFTESQSCATPPNATEY